MLLDRGETRLRRDRACKAEGGRRKIDPVMNLLSLRGDCGSTRLFPTLDYNSPKKLYCLFHFISSSQSAIIPENSRSIPNSPLSFATLRQCHCQT